MPTPKKCCNPLKKSKHNRVYKNLKLITTQWNRIFSNLTGKYICDSCRTSIYSQKVTVSSVEKEIIIDTTEEESSRDENYVDNEKNDPTYKEETAENDMLGRATKRQKLPDADNSLIDETLIRDVNNALSKAIFRSEKIEILTTLPKRISIRKMRELFGVSHKMASRAKKLRKENGYKSCPPKKVGRKISEEIIQKVTEFYLSDDTSRMMPGKKDCVSIKTDVGRENVQKRLLLCNLKEAHKRFQEKFPQFIISCSKFSKLRPKQCISVNKASCHNVCVCKTHQNMRLKFFALKSEFQKKNHTFTLSYHKALREIICKEALPSCHLRNCKNCPGVTAFCEKLHALFTEYSVKEVKYREWISTDRTEFVEQTDSIEAFLEKIRKDLPELLTHDFITKEQSAYFSEKKDSLKEGEFLVTLDFSENYTFQIQDAIQAHHWSNTQATIHPYVMYTRKDGKIVSDNFVIISEIEKHDTVSVHLYNTKLIQYLKDKYAWIERIIYFSDGAASQYKNKSNFLNLIQHENEFRINAEWHFFATSHGKSACDGVGGTIKRNAWKTSMQRTRLDEPLTNAKMLFVWAKNCFHRSMSFAYCTKEEYENEAKLLKPRFSKCKVIKNTRQFHCFLPNDSKSLKCKRYSSASDYEVHNVL